MDKDLPKRKSTRLKGADYSNIGSYFITICTKDRQPILSSIICGSAQSVGTGVPDGPHTIDLNVVLLPEGKIAERYISRLNSYYENVSVDRYVIMPDHIHLLLSIRNVKRYEDEYTDESGPSRTPVPTVNSTISSWISTFKRFCNKECGKNIWQSRFFDHIVRNKNDYDEIIKYIHENPLKWYYEHR